MADHNEHHQDQDPFALLTASTTNVTRPRSSASSSKSLFAVSSPLQPEQEARSSHSRNRASSQATSKLIPIESTSPEFGDFVSGSNSSSHPLGDVAISPTSPLPRLNLTSDPFDVFTAQARVRTAQNSARVLNELRAHEAGDLLGWTNIDSTSGWEETGAGRIDDAKESPLKGKGESSADRAVESEDGKEPLATDLALQRAIKDAEESLIDLSTPIVELPPTTTEPLSEALGAADPFSPLPTTTSVEPPPIPRRGRELATASNSLPTIPSPSSSPQSHSPSLPRPTPSRRTTSPKPIPTRQKSWVSSFLSPSSSSSSNSRILQRTDTGADGEGLPRSPPTTALSLTEDTLFASPAPPMSPISPTGADSLPPVQSSPHTNPDEPEQPPAHARTESQSTLQAILSSFSPLSSIGGTIRRHSRYATEPASTFIGPASSHASSGHATNSAHPTTSSTVASGSGFHSSPFAAHPYTPPSGAPGFTGDRDWRPTSLSSSVHGSSSTNTHGSRHGDSLSNSYHADMLDETGPTIREGMWSTVKLTGRREGTDVVLESVLAGLLRPHLPPLARLPSIWTLLYSLDQHGSSLRTLYSRCSSSSGTSPSFSSSSAWSTAALFEDPPPTTKTNGAPVANVTGAVLAVRDAEGGVFGTWLGEGLSLSHGSYYGGGDAFLWRIRSSVDSEKDDNEVKREVQLFKWTGRNDYVALCDPAFISFGGGDGHYGLYIDASLTSGTTAPCPTFENEPLAQGTRRPGGMVAFDCVGLEVWGVGP